MKRNADLIRSIALATEALESGKYLTELPGTPMVLFAEHVRLMIAAGLVEGRVLDTIGADAEAAVVMRLTWDGHDFLDAARSDTLWKKAKESVIAPTMSWTFDILKEWLKTEIANGFPALR